MELCCFENNNGYDRLVYEQDFSEFCADAWNIIEPNQYVHSYYDTILSRALGAVASGRIRRLIINVAPRSGKSTKCCVLFPAWLWTHRPTLKLLTGSYARDYAIRDATKSRYLFTSPWYQQLWPELIFAKDQNQKTYYRNTKGGERFTFSVGGMITGGGADIIIIDDPLNAMDAFSKRKRDNCNTWFGEALISRLDNQDKGAIIIVMQRLHNEDLTGFLTSAENHGWEHVVLPMEYDANISSKHDKRTTPGELLHKRISKDRLEALKVEMGGLAYAGQYQQTPTIRGGNIIQHDWILTVKRAALPKIIKASWSWDTAIKDGEQNDYSAGVWCGVGDNGQYYIDVRYRERVQYPALKRMVEMLWKERIAQEVLVEDKASGQQLVQDFRRLGIPVIGVIPGKDIPGADKSKMQRLNYCSPLFEAGKVHLVEGRYTAACIEELTGFPAAPHDDILDAITLFLCRERRYDRIKTPRATYI